MKTHHQPADNDLVDVIYGKPNEPLKQVDIGCLQRFVRLPDRNWYICTRNRYSSMWICL